MAGHNTSISGVIVLNPCTTFIVIWLPEGNRHGYASVGSRYIGIAADRALVIEDTTVGAQGAISAGIGMGLHGCGQRAPRTTKSCWTLVVQKSYKPKKSANSLN